MSYFEAAKIMKELGISVGVFVMCFWIVRYVVTNMCAVLLALNNSFTEFTAKVKEEHKAQSELLFQHQQNAAEWHKELMTEHKEIANALGRINGDR